MLKSDTQATHNAHFLRQAQGLICAKSRDYAGCSDLLW